MIEEKAKINSYKLEAYTEDDIKAILKKKNNIIVRNKKELTKLIIEALDNPMAKKNLHLGIIPKITIKKIKKEITDIDKNKINKLFKEDINYALAINQKEIRHIKKKYFTNQDIINFINKIDRLIMEFDSVRYTLYGNQNALRFKKKMDDGTFIAVEVISNKNHTLRTQTLFLDKIDYKARKKELIPNA